MDDTQPLIEHLIELRSRLIRTLAGLLLCFVALVPFSEQLYTFVAQFYPTAVRSTGMGWASGIGRIGAIVGPVLTGALLTFELPHQMNFLVIAIPGVIAALAVFMVNLKVSVDGEKTKSKQVFDAVKSTAN